MKYYQIDIETTAEGIEIVIGKLMAAGIENTAVTDPHDIELLMNRKESYAWDYVDSVLTKKMSEDPKITLYSEEYSDVEKTMRALHELSIEVRDGIYGEGVDFGQLRPIINIRDDSEWKDKWKDYFKTFRVSKHIIVKPTWEKNLEVKPDDIVIEIDPGMAFGTGTHETTSMCIELLDKYMKKDDFVLDAGCGSGILSIAAAKLGAKKVLGIDIDKTAVEVADENIILNGVSDIAAVQYGDVTKGIDISTDLVIANLMAELIVMITPNVPVHLKENGLFITSGILLEKKAMVLEALESSNFEPVEICEKGEWCAIAARKGGEE